MQGNLIYGQYVPDNIDPKKLSRGFLLTVINLIYFFQLIAHVDANLYKELFGIAKLQLEQKKYEME